MKQLPSKPEIFLTRRIAKGLVPSAFHSEIINSLLLFFYLFRSLFSSKGLANDKIYRKENTKMLFSVNIGPLGLLPGTVVWKLWTLNLKL